MENTIYSGWWKKLKPETNVSLAKSFFLNPDLIIHETIIIYTIDCSTFFPVWTFPSMVEHCNYRIHCDPVDSTSQQYWFFIGIPGCFFTMGYFIILDWFEKWWNTLKKNSSTITIRRGFNTSDTGDSIGWRISRRFCGNGRKFLASSTQIQEKNKLINSRVNKIQ